MKNFVLLLAILIISVTSFSQTQTQISRRQIKPDAFRPVNEGALVGTELTFDDPVKKYTLNVTSDIALTLAATGNVDESYIYIYATGDGSHTLGFPSDWVVKSGAYNPNVVQRIFLEYVETPTPAVFVTIEPIVTVIIPTLSTAQIAGGTDDINLNFTAAVTITTAGWTISASGGAVTVSSVVSGSGTAAVVFDLSRNITAGETMTISYNPATGNTTSSTGNEIATITSFFVDTGEGELPDNVLTVDDSGGKDFLTCQECADVATNGQICLIYSGTYRETIDPANDGVTFQVADGETAIISGLNTVATSWTSHDLTGGKSIYKTTITLPVDNTEGYNLTISNSNTTLFNNQIFKGSTMQFEARYPNIVDESDLLEFTGNMRHYSDATGDVINPTSLTDTGIPTTGLVGAKMPMHGWFWNRGRTVLTQPSQTNITFANISDNGGLNKYRHWWYVCGKLVLLNAEKEWAYDPATNTLYLWQTGGGSPTGIEYKARNWGFDLRGRDNIVIKGLTFIGCEVANGDTNTDGCTIDNVRATYTNHDVMYEDVFPGYGNATETGTKLLGINNTVKNSEFRYTAAHGVWLGTGGVFHNNWYRDCGYDGSWGAPVSFAGNYTTVSGGPVSEMAMWGDADNVTITNNTFERTGRSGVDMSFSYTPEGEHDNHNIEIAYNEFTMWGMINVDLGAIYGWGFRDMTGSSIHHNWFHDDGVLADPTGAALHGGQYAIYFDQACGPFTVHHNIVSSCWSGLPTNAGDCYNQPNFEHRNAGSTSYYNNTFMSDGPFSHKVSVSSPKDVWRNNILYARLNDNWGGANPMNEQYNLFNVESAYTVGATLGTGSVENADFTGTNIFAAGSGSMAFIPSTGSIARNTGTVLTGITDLYGDDGTPDKGARRFGDADPWVAGYNAAATDNDVYIEDNNLVYTSYSVTPTVQTNQAYHPNPGTSSFFNTDEAYIEITLSPSATGFEWYAEEFKHSAIVEVQVDTGSGYVRQDCDNVTGGTQDCDLYVDAEVKNSSLIFTKTGMSVGAKKVKLINKSANVSSTGQFLTHDAIKQTF